MILEAFVLNVKAGMGSQFEEAMREAAKYIASTPGYSSHEIHRCLETPDQYIFLARWETLESHTQGFRGSEAYQEWKRLTHHFYDPFPTVLHYEQVLSYK
jgi:heme-degrading monooxygenase HmoA